MSRLTLIDIDIDIETLSLAVVVDGDGGSGRKVGQGERKLLASVGRARGRGGGSGQGCELANTCLPAQPLSPAHTLQQANRAFGTTPGRPFLLLRGSASDQVARRRTKEKISMRDPGSIWLHADSQTGREMK